MEYPAEFTKSVKAEYPDWSELHERLDRGSQTVGRYLEDEAGWGLAAEKVLEHLESGSLAELREKAEKIIRRRALVLEWHGIYENQVERDRGSQKAL